MVPLLAALFDILYFHEASTVSRTFASNEARFELNRLAAWELAAEEGFGSGRSDWILVRRAETS